MVVPSARVAGPVNASRSESTTVSRVSTPSTGSPQALTQRLATSGKSGLDSTDAQPGGQIPRPAHVHETELARVGAHEGVRNDSTARPGGDGRVLQHDQVVARAVPAEHRDRDRQVRPGRASGVRAASSRSAARVARAAPIGPINPLAGTAASRARNGAESGLGPLDVVPRAGQSPPG